MARSKSRADRQTEEESHDEIRILAASHGAAAIAELLRLGSEAESESVQLAALRELLDRGFGRVPAAAASGDGQTVSYLIVDDGYDA